MNSRNRVSLRLAAAGAVLCLMGAVAPARAGMDMKEPDSMITMMSKISLLTAEDLHVWDINVDTVDNAVTLHGKVPNATEKARAEAVVKNVEGVKSVQNLLQIVPDEHKTHVEEKDDVIRDRVKKALDAAGDSVDGVNLASVNKGVVLLSGKATLSSKLHAIETVHDVAGVRRVASEIETAS